MNHFFFAVAFHLKREFRQHGRGADGKQDGKQDQREQDVPLLTISPRLAE